MPVRTPPALVGWSSAEGDRLMDDHFLLTRAGEEHTVDLVSVRAVQIDVLSVECLHQDKLGLVKSTKYQVVEVEAAALFDAGADSNLQVLRLVD